MIIAEGDLAGERVGKQDLFRETEGEKIDAPAERIRPEAPVLRILELRDHLVVQHDGAGDELGKERDKGQVLQQRIMRRVSQRPIGDEGNLLEGEEADSERQHDVAERPVSPEDRIAGGKKKIRVFEVEQHREISGGTEDKE